MYRPAESVDWCQCCQQGVTLADFECSSDFFRNNNTPKVVHSSDNPCCGARHLPASTALLGICRPLPLALVAPPATGGAPIAPQLLSFFYLLYRHLVGGDAYIDPRADVGIRPYNNFTNYAVSICKLTEIIPLYLHLVFIMLL